jgi:antitoxin component HigA of HigAB toxin-antitoxin module
MDVKPIRNSKQHRAALKEIERLWKAKPGTPEHHNLEVLSGRRRLTLEMMRRLHEQLGIPADVLLAP